MRGAPFFFFFFVQHVFQIHYGRALDITYDHHLPFEIHNNTGPCVTSLGVNWLIAYYKPNILSRAYALS